MSLLENELSTGVKKQHDLAFSALTIIAHYHGVAANGEDLKHQFSDGNGGLTTTQWLLAAKSLGLKAKLVRQDINRLHLISLPAVVWREDGEHFILAKIDNNKYLIQDLELGRPVVLDKGDLKKP